MGKRKSDPAEPEGTPLEALEDVKPEKEELKGTPANVKPATKKAAAKLQRKS